MGAARKLQVEIDRTLKKVQEGIVEFDQIWEKVYDTESQSQREKYEADLKKEIKKLQRLRDQIKTWIAGSDIKDKTALMEARKNIEKEMERFKHCEKEAKTKAFSKAGLGQATKLDPEEKARQAAREWLNEQVEALQMQIDEFEAELEGINGTKRGKKPTQRQQSLEELVVRHKSHIARLEQCMRCLDNCTVTHEEIEELKEMVEWYVDDYDNEDAGFECVDETYAPLLDRLNDVTLGLQAANIAAKVKKSKDLEEEQAERDREKERAAAAAVKAQLLSHGSNSMTTALEEEKKVAGRTTAAPISLRPGQPTMKRRVSMSEVPSGNHEEMEGISPATKNTVLGSAAKNDVPNGALSFASAAARNAPAPGQRTAAAWDSAKGEEVEYPKLAGNAEKSKSLDLLPESKPGMKRSSLDTNVLLGQSGLKPAAGTPFAGTALHSSSSGDMAQGSLSKTSSQDGNRTNHAVEKPLGFKAAVLGGAASSSKEAVSDPPAFIDPMLSTVDLTDLTKSLSMSCEEVSSMPLPPSPFEGNPTASLQLLQACSRRSMPQPIDGDYKIQLSQNTSRSIAQQLPASFPIHRLPQLEDPNFYQQLDTEGLFYSFYFLPGDVTQYCAAKELKRQSWRYHTEYKSWFQRSGEPKAATKDYEEGCYVYFDKALAGGSLPGEPENFMSGWCYRKKDNFMFRYDQLEDELR